MKIFMKFLYAIAIIALFLIFFDSGWSASDKKYFKDVVLAEKGENNLENNQKEPFIGQLFAKNGLMYKQEKIGSIVFNDTVTIKDKQQIISLNIDIYQTLGFYVDMEMPTLYHGILNEFLVDGVTKEIVITGHYDKPLSYDRTFMNYTVKDLDFPIFGINNVNMSGTINNLESVIFKYNDTLLTELVIIKSNTEESIVKTNFAELENYEEDNGKMLGDIDKILRVKVGRYEFPNDEELIKLNELGYNFHIFTGQEAYNYLIYIYAGVSILLAGLSLYFVIVKPILKNRKRTK